ncbi:MAG: DUF362 domain-containing protein [Eggerthellaceae bacterium]|nr:DUF362 domain-containing protein [Candidatus Aphodovivens avicola]
MGSQVCFADMHAKAGDSILAKFERLIEKAGIDQIDFKDKFVAVKVHFGEVGNMAFLRHQYAKVLCDHIKARGGKPFLTDCNTLYVGYRNNALNHLDAAFINGYNPLSTGVHTIIADGLRGTDEREIPVVGGEYVKEAKIGAAVAEADIIVSLTHFKGHVNAGFGGALKNIGMGCGSKKGKMEMHSSGTPRIDGGKCIGCGMCVDHCANDGVHVVDGTAVIDEGHCVGCGYCIAYCPAGAIMTKWDEAKPVMNKKIAEYTKAVLDGKPSFHVSLVLDVSPDCDCERHNDVPVIPNVGMFASFDPVALDQACVDAANKQPVIQGSKADPQVKEASASDHMDGARAIPEQAYSEHAAGDDGHDVFRMVHPDTDWAAGLDHAVKLGIGTREYELVVVR